jgi:FtsH-binding integral membrane protein
MYHHPQSQQGMPPGPRFAGGRAVNFDAVEEQARTFLWKVYGWMSLGLGVTGVAAMIIAMMSLGVGRDGFTYMTPFGELIYSPLVRFGSMIVAFGMVFAISGLQHRLSAMAAGALFLLFATIMGLSTSAIFLIYTAESIGLTFLVTAGMFASTSLYGYVAKRDLSSVGSFAFMGLIGIILASLVNFFLQSPMLYWIISVVGVLVFVGLTAWDTQKLRQIGGMGLSSDEASRASIQGALMLYLDFLNIFLFLLHLFGRRD